MFVEDADRGKGAVLFHNEDLIHVRGIAEGDALLCEAVVHLILHLVDDDHGIGRNTSLNFQKEGGSDETSAEIRGFV